MSHSEIVQIYHSFALNTTTSSNYYTMKECLIYLNSDMRSLSPSSTKNLSWIFVEIHNRTLTCVHIWNTIYNDIDFNTWEMTFKIPFMCTCDTKLQSFQFMYRIMITIIQCNKWLFIGLHPSDIIYL